MISAGALLLDGAGGASPVDWLAVHVAADAVIAASFFAIPIGLIWYLRHRLDVLREYRVAAWLVGAFILAAGTTHLLGVLSGWYSVHALQALSKVLTAAFSTAAVALVWPLLPHLVRMPSARQLAEVNERLRREAEAHETTLRELEDARRELENRVQARTRELSEIKARFETALRGAKVYVFSQDRDLKYTWMYSPRGDDVAAQIIGKTDRELGSSPEHQAMIALKKRVVASGRPESGELAYVMPEQRAVYTLHVDPLFGPDGRIDGIMCAAIDVSRVRLLESEQRRLTEELGTALQRYETALRGSHVTVFTQDRNLRYTSISNPMFGRTIEQIVGRTDDDLLPAEGRGSAVELKRQVLREGQPKDAEIRIPDASGIRWCDVHIEPLRDVAGGIVGITCAAVDITHRKESEAHLRDLMRELTHRSKNLLAVIQAMARQTARHAHTVDAFVEQFGARIQALAASHDILVQESWHGAALIELVHSQLGPYLAGKDARVLASGPPIVLKPEAAQSLGLALHELAANAVRYGALSTPGGKVALEWRNVDGAAVELTWREQGGPPVAAPERRGFGSMMIERNLARTLDAQVDLDFAAEGLRCRLLIPRSHLAAEH